MDYIIAWTVFALLVGVTALLLTGRGANLIAGFNTLPKDEKEKFDKPALCKFVGKALIPFVVAFIIGAVAVMTGAAWRTLFFISIGIAGLPYVIVLSVYTETGNRFKK